MITNKFGKSKDIETDYISNGFVKKMFIKKIFFLKNIIIW